MDGYWTIHYEIGAAHGDGIAMLHDGEFVGGDFEHAFTGTYEADELKADEATLSARIRIAPSVSSEEERIMAREKPLIFSLHGYRTGDFAALEGAAEHRKDQRVAIIMRKCKGTLRDLPEQPLGKKAA